MKFTILTFAVFGFLAPHVFSQSPVRSPMARPTSIEPHTPVPAEIAELEKAADWGSKEAALKLAKKYETGDGVSKDALKADWWYSQADLNKHDLSAKPVSEVIKEQVATGWKSITGTLASWGSTAQNKAEAYQKATSQYITDHPELQEVATQALIEAAQNYFGGGDGSSGTITPQQASDAGRTLRQYREQQQGK